MRILVSAGDASGEQHAAALVEELARRRSDLAWSGLGGPALAKAGVALRVAQRELAVGGLFELASDLPRVARAYWRMARALVASRPDLALLVDSPDFNLPLARRAKRLGIPVLYFISPQVWAWRRGRARKLARRVERLAVILPFEAEAYAGTGLRVDFVGHPLVERLAELAAQEPRALRRRLGLAEECPLVALFPGSRRNEIAANLRLQLETARALHARDPRVQFALAVAPSLDARSLEREVRAAALPRGLALTLLAGESAALARCADAALSKPGTVTLELALLGTPQLVAARVGVASAFVLRRLVALRWWALPNLIAGEALVPELLQEAAQPAPLAEGLLRLLHGEEGRSQRAALARVRKALGEQRTSARLADIVEEMLGPLAHSGAALSALLGAPLLAVGCACSGRVRAGIGERLGAHPGASVPAPIWLHGASVGEVRCAVKLARALSARGLAVVGSATTTSGRARWRALAPEIPAGLAPLDHPWLVRRALGRVAPRALVLVETELWPCWIAAARERGAPVAIASGRLSDRSFPRYRRARPLLRRVLANVAAIGARSATDAERFVALGADPARVRVTGDLKLEPEPAVPLAPELAAALGALPLFVAGSTHPGEEEAALVALAAVEAQGASLALVLAPRHVGRAAEVASLAVGRRVLRRSALGAAPLRAGDVLVLDTLGELAALYARARIAFVGGTLAPGVGGHDPAEPAHAGVPVCFGPHTQNVCATADLLLRCGAGERVADARALGRAVSAALADPRAAAGRGTRGRLALLGQAGATERTLALLEGVLGERR